ncbi:COG0863 DNA modification methylase [uncultured Caudovirales phage]|uniref:COG0863 DNA modification methylase n=1 Tax=uncultured Caudovirales phage TaxID=2100421 RepID=A0A6J5Q813_9CAUD|nr:COG0863 DNA modification methylase [uncultured Caudovirales phage]
MAKKPAATEISYLPAAGLIPYAKNSRTHSERQIAKLAASVDSFGMVGAIIVRSGVIAKGHGTLAGVQKLYAAGKRVYPPPGRVECEAAGIDPIPAGTVPVIDASGWTESQFKAFVIADNRLAEDAGWDEDLLKLELGDLIEAGFDVSLTGFNEDEINALLGAGTTGLTDPDDVPPVPLEPVTKPGDTWILGPHRLACADATNIPAVEKMMSGAKGDLVFTDPPYNVDYDGKKSNASRSQEKIKNDKMSPEQFLQFCRDFFASYVAVTKPGAAFYVCHASRSELEFLRAFRESGLHYAAAIIWVKDSLVLSRGDYHFQHEPIIYGAKNGADVQFHGDPTDGHYDAGHEMITYSWQKAGTHKFFGDRKQTTVWEIARPKSSTMHPTQKPVDLIARAIMNSSKSGDLVVDLFGGSGSTMLACEKLGRVARCTELDPLFCDVIVQRWQNFTGKLATLEDGGKTFAEMLKVRGVTRPVPGAEKDVDKPRTGKKKPAAKKPAKKK